MPAQPSTTPRNLTDVFVRGFKNLTSRRLEVRDTYVTGLVLRVTPKGAKTFSLQTRLINGEKIQLKIGSYPAISVKDARETAKGHLASIARGEDPRDIARIAKELADAGGMTLRSLLDEAEVQFAPTQAIWRRNSRFGRNQAEARAAIENVFGPLLDKSLIRLTASRYSSVIRAYKPKRPKQGKTTAYGSASRALAYLRPVFDWASGRGRFAKLGAAREQRLDLPDLSTIQDPSIGDPTLEFRRERVLSQDELGAVLPHLTYPAPQGLRQKIDPRDDYGPIALRFLFLTLSRREEVSDARRGEFDIRARTWTKHVKTKRKAGARASAERRQVTIPLSDDAISLLLSLPSFVNGRPDDLVFPSSTGGRLSNWHRTQKTICNASRTSGWHRHDLRRTGATLLRQLGVAPGVIDTLLCHVNPLSAEKVSGSAANYIFDTKILSKVVDQERVAANLLAQALVSICGPQLDAPVAELIPYSAFTQKPQTRSPWAVVG